MDRTEPQPERLLNPRCPECGSKAALRVEGPFRSLVAILMAKAGIEELPEGIALWYKCSWCKTIRSVSVRDFVGYALEQLTTTE